MSNGAIALYRGNGRTVALGSQSVIWACRMLVGEGWQHGKGEAILWAMLYRYLGMPHKWDSWTEMIRLFSQPINARWIPGGDLYEKYKTSKKEVYQIATDAAHTKRRLKIQSMQWVDFPERLKVIVTDFALGVLPVPEVFAGKKISNFASYKGVQTKYPNGINIGGDWFFVDPQLKSDLTVEIIPGAGSSYADKVTDTEKKNPTVI